MSEFFNALVQHHFMQHALAACILASLGCGTVGVYVVVKRIGFLAGGIAHTVLAGMGIAYFLGKSPIAGAVIVALLSAVLIGWIKLRWAQEEDVLIAAFWSVGMAIGVLFISRTPGYAVDLTSYLFGNILLVSGEDLVMMAAVDAIVMVSVLLLYRQFLATVFDEEHARLRGVRVDVLYIYLLCIVALTVVLLIQIVGLILVMALLVLPAATAASFAGSVSRMMWLAVAVSMVATVAGLGLSYAPDLPSGATMVVVAGLIYLVSIVFRIYGGRRPRPQAP